MVGVMNKLLKRQTAPNVDVDVFIGDPVNYHCFIPVFEEVVEKKVEDLRGRLTRLVRYTDGEPKEMIKHCIQEECKIIAGRKVWESTLHNSSLPKGN